jgi:hypothetical protein
MLAPDFEKRLLSVDWKTWHRPPFQRIPDAILQFVAAWQEGRAGGDLEGAVLPQASLDEGTFLAIPFLQELLEARIGTEQVYDLLRVIAVCTDQYWVDNTPDPVFHDLVARCRARLQAGLDLYLDDLQDTELSIAAHIGLLSILHFLPQSRAEWLPVVIRVRDLAPDGPIAAEISELLA